jgi:uncharacterized membrane protein
MKLFTSLISPLIAPLISPRWRVAVGILLLGILMTLLYDFALALPIGLRNLAGVILFACIMLGAGFSYFGARWAGASPGQATKVSLLLPVLWHLKEIWMAGKIFGFSAGVYAGLQGFYLFYYALIFLVIFVAHLLCELINRMRKSNDNSSWLYAGYFLIPMVTICLLEWVGWLLTGKDIFMFQGYLGGYRYLFM